MRVLARVNEQEIAAARGPRPAAADMALRTRVSATDSGIGAIIDGLRAAALTVPVVSARRPGGRSPAATRARSTGLAMCVRELRPRRARGPLPGASPPSTGLPRRVPREEALTPPSSLTARHAVGAPMTHLTAAT